jgi:hypothetical protein
MKSSPLLLYHSPIDKKLPKSPQTSEVFTHHLSLVTQRLFGVGVGSGLVCGNGRPDVITVVPVIVAVGVMA